MSENNLIDLTNRSKNIRDRFNQEIKVLILKA